MAEKRTVHDVGKTGTGEDWIIVEAWMGRSPNYHLNQKGGQMIQHIQLLFYDHHNYKWVLQNLDDCMSMLSIRIREGVATLKNLFNQ